MFSNDILISLMNNNNNNSLTLRKLELRYFHSLDLSVISELLTSFPHLEILDLQADDDNDYIEYSNILCHKKMKLSGIIRTSLSSVSQINHFVDVYIKLVFSPLTPVSIMIRVFVL